MSGNFGYSYSGAASSDSGGGKYIAEKWNNDFGFDDNIDDDDLQWHEKYYKIINALREQIRQNIEEISWHKKKERFMQHEKTNMELKILNLRRELDHLKSISEIRDMKFGDDGMSSTFILTHKALEKNNKELRETIAELESQLKQLRDFDNDILADRLQPKRYIVPGLNDAQLTNRVETLTNQNYRLSKMNKELQTEMKQLKENQISEHINVMTLSDKYNEILNENKNLKITNQTLETKVNELQYELMENNRIMEITNSTKELSYLEELRVKYIRCLSNKMTIMENKTQIDNLIARLDDSFSDSSNFDDQLKRLMELYNGLQTAYRNTNILVEQCQQELESQREVIQKLKDEKGALANDVARVRNVMSANMEESQDFNKKCIEYESSIYFSQAEIKSLNDSISSLKEKLSAEQVIIKSLREELNKKGVIIKSLKDDIEDCKSKNSTLQKYIGDTTDNSELMNLNLNAEQTITKLRMDLNDIKIKNESLNRENQDFQLLNVNLAAKDMQNGMTINSLQLEKKAMKQENIDLKKDLDSKTKEALRNIQTIQSLEIEKKVLKENIETLEQTLNNAQSSGTEKELELIKENEKQLEINKTLQQLIDNTQSVKSTNEEEINLLRKKQDELENIIHNEKQLNANKTAESEKDKKEITALKQNQNILGDAIKDLKQKLKTAESKQVDKEPVKVDVKSDTVGKENATVDKGGATIDKEELKKDKDEEIRLLKEEKRKLEATIKNLDKKVTDNQIQETARTKEVESLQNTKLEYEEMIQLIQRQLNESEKQIIH